MTRAWDSDDKIFVLVLMAAVISQTATSKNIVGATAKATLAVFERTVTEPAAVRQRKPVQAIHRLNPLWAGTVAFFKATVTGVANVAGRAGTNVEHSFILAPIMARFAAEAADGSPQDLCIAFDRLRWPWKKRTRTSSLSLPTDPRVAATLQPPRF